MVECLSVYYLINSFKELDISLLKSTFAHVTSTLVGVISFIPGGIGASEFTTSNIFLKYGVESFFYYSCLYNQNNYNSMQPF